ncbi:MAG TPA: porin family protein [Ignavibacteriaceae bacterium]|nr:porin family protein [Ignavibacteriaceae bacterium]
MLRIVIAVLALFFIMNIEISAQSHRNETGLGLGVQLGYQRASDADAGKLLYGVLMRAKISESLGIEGAISYRQEKYFNSRMTVRSWPVTVSALFYPFPPMIYLLAGGGWYHTTIDFTPGLSEVDLNDQTRNPFGWHLGGGVEIPIGESLNLFGDIRYVFLNYNLDDLNIGQLKDIKSNFYTINVGLMFGFR